MTNLATPMQMRPHQWSKERFPLIAHLARYPFMYASLLLHTLLLWIFSSLGAMQLEQQTQVRNENVVQASMQKARQGELQKRVQEIARIRSLLEKSLSDAHSSSQNSAQNIDDSEADAPPQTAEQSLQRAQDLLASIQKIEERIKIREMTRVLQISERQAEKKQQAWRAQEQPEQKKPTPTLEQIEHSAKDALSHRQQQLERSESGLPILGGVRNFVQQAQELLVPGGTGGTSGAQQDGPGNTNGRARKLSGLRGDGELSSISATQAVSQRPASGNTFGAGGHYAGRIAVNSWYIIGPFEGAGNASIQTKYPPELLVDLDASYFGKQQRVIQWNYMHTNQYPMIPTLRGEFAVYYGYAEIRMDEARDVWLSMNASDNFKVWVNDRVVWVRANEEQPVQEVSLSGWKNKPQNVNLSQDRRKLHLNKGKNTLMFKLYNGADAMFFSLALAAETVN